MGPEAKEEVAVCRTVFEKYGIRNHKLQGIGGAGNEDRFFYRKVNGNPVGAFVEFKRKGEKPRKLQQYRMKLHRLEGFPAESFDNRTDAIAWLRKIFGEDE